MTTVEITVGWTRSDMDNGYSSFHDGYRPGASQHTETITVEMDERVPLADWPEHVAEAVFGATNNPSAVTGLEAQIRNGIEATGYHGQGAHYSLSVGDTVTVGEIMLACDSFGWKRVVGSPS